MDKATDSRHKLLQFVYLCAILIPLASAITLVGGHFQLSAIIRILPNLKTWQYNIALFLVIAGAVFWLTFMVIWMIRSHSKNQHLQEELSNIFKFIPSGLIETDSDGRIKMANPEAERIFGYSENELKQMRIENLIPDELKQRHEQHRIDFLKKPVARQMGAGRDLMALTKNGRKIPVEIGLNPIFTDKGLRILSTIVDISERKHAEETIREHAKRLEIVNQELSQFAYIASHDLRSPLRAIENLASWIEEDSAEQLPENSKQDLKLLKERIKRMENLLNGLLEYSRLGRIRQEYENIDCTAVISDIEKLLDIPPDFKISTTSPLPTLKAPAAAIELICRNLIANAIKHNDKTEGCITISAKENKDFHEIHFEDDGPGIPPQYHQQIFRIFQTLKPLDQVEGSGMGLALVKKTLENHGGKIEVESDPTTGTRGCRFIVSWPRR